MKAILLLRQRVVLRDGLFKEFVIWKLPNPLPGSTHSYKYRMALIAENICVLRYDNEAGKGDHRHVGQAEQPYTFTNITELLNDFEASIRSYLHDHPHHRQPD